MPSTSTGWLASAGPAKSAAPASAKLVATRLRILVMYLPFLGSRAITRCVSFATPGRFIREDASVEREEARSRIRKLLVTGDNRLKQGVDPEKARESFERALAVAREAGLEEAVRPLVEIRLADLETRARESAPPEPPSA